MWFHMSKDCSLGRDYTIHDRPMKHIQSETTDSSSNPAISKLCLLGQIWCMGNAMPTVSSTESSVALLLLLAFMLHRETLWAVASSSKSEHEVMVQQIIDANAQSVSLCSTSTRRSIIMMELSGLAGMGMAFPIHSAYPGNTVHSLCKNHLRFGDHCSSPFIPTLSGRGLF